MSSVIINDENDPEVYRISKNTQSFSNSALSGTKKVMAISEQERKMDGAPVGELFDIDVKNNEDLKPYTQDNVGELISGMTLEETSASSWADQFEDIEKIRRVVLHHSELLHPPELMSVAVSIILNCGLSSLRSSCIKNALQCSASLLSSYSYAQLRPYLTPVITAMLLKAVSGPKFMCKLADSCLIKALCLDANTVSSPSKSSSSSQSHDEESAVELPSGSSISSQQNLGCIDALEILSSPDFTGHKSADVITAVNKLLLMALTEFGSVYGATRAPVTPRTPRQLTPAQYERVLGLAQRIAESFLHCIYHSANTKQAKAKEHARQALQQIALSVCPVLVKVQPVVSSAGTTGETPTSPTMVPEPSSSATTTTPTFKDARHMFMCMYEPFVNPAQQAEVAKLVIGGGNGVGSSSVGLSKRRVPVSALKSGLVVTRKLASKANVKTSTSLNPAEVTSSVPVPVAQTADAAASVFRFPVNISDSSRTTAVVALPLATKKPVEAHAAAAKVAKSVEGTASSLVTRRKRCYSDSTGSSSTSSGSGLLMSRKVSSSSKVVIYSDEVGPEDQLKE